MYLKPSPAVPRARRAAGPTQRPPQGFRNPLTSQPPLLANVICLSFSVKVSGRVF